MASSVVIVSEYIIEGLSLEEYILRRTVVCSGQRGVNLTSRRVRPRVWSIYKAVCVNWQVRLILGLKYDKF